MTEAATVKIDPHFERLCPPLEASELAFLRQDVLEHGVRDPLTVWKETGILLDGHNRLRICREHGLPYQVTEFSFSTRHDAHNWVIRHQLGRRNLDPNQAAYLRGKWYHEEKAEREATLKRGNQDAEPGEPVGQSDPPGSTAERIAAETGVSASTVKRDAKTAAAIDAIADSAGEDARDLVLRRSSGLSRADLDTIAQAAPRSAEEVSEIIRRKTEERRAQLRDRRAPSVTGSWGQQTIVRQIPGEDDQGVYIAAMELSCGCTVKAAHRKAYPSKRKTAPCPNCNPGTRTPHERRQDERHCEEVIRRCIRDPERMSSLIAIVMSAMKLTAMRHQDARGQRLIEQIATAGQELEIVRQA